MFADQMASCTPNLIKVEQMKRIRNLLEVKISDEQLKCANLTDGIEIQVRSERAFTVNAYWISKIQDIHTEIGKDWKTMRDELWDGKFLTEPNQSLLQNKPQIYQEINAPVKVCIKPPKTIDASYLASIVPRDFYPLVIIVTCHEEEPDPQACDAAATIMLIHIKDETVPVRTHIIKQYTKQVDGHILDISQLFVEETVACIICFEEPDLSVGLKLLCLLPCRHSPICSDCIRRIRECPKCRSPIVSVFDINAPPASIADGQSAHQPFQPSDEQPRRSKGFFSSMKQMLFGI